MSTMGREAQNDLHSAVGESVLAFRAGMPLQRLQTNEVFSQAQVVALVAIDTSIAACSLAVLRLDALASKLGGRLIICAIQAHASSISLEEFLSQSFSDYVIVADEARTKNTLMIAGITMSMSYPDVSLVSGTGRLLAVDVWPVLRNEEQKCFTLDNFPAGWHTNTWSASCLPPSDPCVRFDGPTLVSARAHPDSALQAGLYPGDAVIVRRIGPSNDAAASSSLTVYANAPIPEEIEERLAGDVLPEPRPHHLWLPPAVWRDLGLEAVQAEVTVVTTPYLDVPEAEVVVLQRKSTVLPADKARALACAWLGVHGKEEEQGPARELVEAVAALRAGQDEASVSAQLQQQQTADTDTPQYSASVHSHLSSAEVAMLQEHVSRGQCRYAVLSAGQTFALPLRKGEEWTREGKSWLDCTGGESPSLFPYVVQSTVPRYTAVVVGPHTQVQVV